MTTDLWMLSATALLCLSNPVVYAIDGFSVPGGYSWSFGNRDRTLNIPAWNARAEQAHRNMLETSLRLRF